MGNVSNLILGLILVLAAKYNTVLCGGGCTVNPCDVLIKSKCQYTRLFNTNHDLFLYTDAAILYDYFLCTEVKMKSFKNIFLNIIAL